MFSNMPNSCSSFVDVVQLNAEEQKGNRLIELNERTRRKRKRGQERKNRESSFEWQEGDLPVPGGESLYPFTTNDFLSFSSFYIFKGFRLSGKEFSRKMECFWYTSYWRFWYMSYWRFCTEIDGRTVHSCLVNELAKPRANKCPLLFVKSMSSVGWLFDWHPFCGVLDPF